MSPRLQRAVNRENQYTSEVLKAAAQHTASLASLPPELVIDDITLFAVFQMDCGDTDMWEFRKSTGGRNCVDKTALTPAELNRAQDKERGERVAKLRSLMDAGYNPDIDADNVCITDLLPKPEYV